VRWWSRLTVRGRITGLIGMLVAAVSWWFGELDLFWLGAFAVAVVVCALIMASWPVHGLGHVRRVPVGTVPIGTRFTVQVKVARPHRAWPRLLHFEDVVPPSLGSRPRFAALSVLGDEGQEFRYSLTGTRRGRHRIGPLLVRSLDPFGMARNDMAFATVTEIAVTPRVHQLGRLQIGAAGAASDTSISTAGLVGQDEVLLREYRPGDDVRRVHWRSSARVGSLMVRREEQAWQPNARIIIDNRYGAHAGRGPGASFEWAVSAAASIGMALLNNGCAFEMSDATGPLLGREADRTVYTQQLLEALTDISLVKSASLNLEPVGHDRRQGEAIIAVLGRLGTQDLASLMDARPGSGTAHALVLDSDTFGGGAPDPQQARLAGLLREHGWTVVSVDAELSIPRAWQLLHEARAVA